MHKNILILAIIVLNFLNLSAQDFSFDPQIEIQKWKYGYQSAFSFTFDDGLLTQYEFAKPVLEQYYFRGTFYVLPPYLTETLPGIWRYGTWPMFQSMSWDGHEIGSHTLNHPSLISLPVGDTLTPNTIHYELYHSKKQIQLRTEKTCLSIAYPYSEHNSLVDSLTADYYTSGRSVGPLPNDESQINWYGLRSYPVTFSLPRNSASDDLDELNSFKEWTENSIADSSWGIIMIHEVVPFEQVADLLNQGLYEPMSTEWLSLYCEWLQNKMYDTEVWVSTVEDITKYSKERDNSQYEIVSVSEDQMKFRLYNNLDQEIFNYQLTLLVSVPNDWTNAFFSQGSYNDSLKTFESHLGNTVMCYVVPDGNAFILSKNPLTDIDENYPKISEFSLKQNYPNPFNPTTKIEFTVPSNSKHQTSKVSLTIYDVLGNEIETLIDAELSAGTHKVEFNARNLSSGIYFYKLQAGSFVESRKMILLK